MSVEDYHSLPGKSFSLIGDANGKHLKRTYLSGVNMAYVDFENFYDLRGRIISAEVYYDAGGEKRGGNGDAPYIIKINQKLSPKEKAATLVHETLEGSAFMNGNGEIVHGDVQPWHAKARIGEVDDLYDIMYNYMNEGGFDYDAFLKANYDDKLEGLAGEAYGSDEVYKAEYRAMHEQ